MYRIVIYMPILLTSVAERRILPVCRITTSLMLPDDLFTHPLAMPHSPNANKSFSYHIPPIIASARQEPMQRTYLIIR
jgi:hypothetical protein